MDQFAHASSIELVTTEGKIAQYYLGVEYSPQDMRAGPDRSFAWTRSATPVDRF